ncbi:hypothetical protein GGR56DRAFT_196128 [Xylariaceae sp. FL0804]|nr:hypothetical protein GGR56DRAFT_196128 [Xylariaceae sp. FL0804]
MPVCGPIAVCSCWPAGQSPLSAQRPLQTICTSTGKCKQGKCKEMGKPAYTIRSRGTSLTWPTHRAWTTSRNSDPACTYTYYLILSHHRHSLPSKSFIHFTSPFVSPSVTHWQSRAASLYVRPAASLRQSFSPSHLSESPDRDVGTPPAKTVRHLSLIA